MGGNRKGGLKAAKTNQDKYGVDFYSKIGSLGGKSSNTGGFQKGSEAAREAGRLGGSRGSRKGIKNSPKEES